MRTHLKLFTVFVFLLALGCNLSSADDDNHEGGNEQPPDSEQPPVSTDADIAANSGDSQPDSVGTDEPQQQDGEPQTDGGEPQADGGDNQQGDVTPPDDPPQVCRVG